MTVHLVTAELDAGPIVVQRTVPVLDGDTEETLAARILVEEHGRYPEAVQRVLDGAGVSTAVASCTASGLTALGLG